MNPTSTCHTCPGACRSGASAGGRLENLREGVDFVIALAGNPNTGKTTVFNQLTGLRQHTGNWPGKTVTRAEGTFVHAGRRFKLVDLPGTYSLLANSEDEAVARDFVLFGRPDCTVVVCDATVLERNLHLVLQILEITDRTVVCANLIDEADRKQIALEARVLEKKLGVPVVPTAARRGQGLDHLVRHIHEIASGMVTTRPIRADLDHTIETAIGKLVTRLTELIPTLPCPRWIAMRLLDGDERIRSALLSGELAALAAGSPVVSPSGAQV